MTIRRDAVYAVSEDVVAREIEGEIIIVPSGGRHRRPGGRTLHPQRDRQGHLGQAGWPAQPERGDRRACRRVPGRPGRDSKPTSWVWWPNCSGGGCWLPSNLPKPYLYSVPGGVLSLSGLALQEFLRAVLVRGPPSGSRPGGSACTLYSGRGCGDRIRPSGWRQPRPGEVVAFCHPETGKLVVHRVLARRSGGYLLRGDNALEADGLIPPAYILGRVDRVERRGRRVRLGQGPERRAHRPAGPLRAVATRDRPSAPAYWRPLQKRCPA